MQRNSWKSSISVKLGLMQFLTGLAIFLMFIALLYWSGFRPYKEAKVESLSQLARFALQKYTEDDSYDSSKVTSLLKSLLESSPDILAVGIEDGAQTAFAGLGTELQRAGVKQYLATPSARFIDNRLYLALQYPTSDHRIVLWMISDTSTVQHRQRFILIWGCILFCAAVGVALAAASPVSRSISRRIKLLAKKFSDGERTGDLGRPVPVEGSDELTILMSGFNRLIGRLEEDNKRKDEFIGIVSHELRTPLTVVKGYLDLLQEAGGNDDATILARAQKNLFKLDGLTRDLLEVSRIQTGAFRCREDLVDLSKTLLESVTEMQASNPHRVIEFIRPDRSYIVMGDAERISQVISKFINNALKFSAPDKKVELSHSVLKSAIRISVRDFGRGVPIDEQVFIFEKFARPANFNPQLSGFGVGLYISKAIIKCHKGEIGMHDNDIGSTFYFSIPLHKM